MMDQLAVWKSHELTPEQKAQVYELSGGHPGLIVVLFELRGQERPLAWSSWAEWLLGETAVAEECRKLWAGLAEDERLALLNFPRTRSAADVITLLQIIGIVLPDKNELFSPIFSLFVDQQGKLLDRTLQLDRVKHFCLIGTQPVENLTSRQFDFLAFLHENKGDVCSREFILENLYPGEINTGTSDNRLDNLARHVRQKLKAVAGTDSYLQTEWGIGYRLLNEPPGDL
ncbi:MAG: winged helix-turn-helix transcriptional regulator [Chloroflexi bacterium]|nr:winged helix-turn-helix transcriptional regulator [Chloroflexota bacterium]